VDPDNSALKSVDTVPYPDARKFEVSPRFPLEYSV